MALQRGVRDGHSAAQLEWKGYGGVYRAFFRKGGNRVPRDLRHRLNDRRAGEISFN